MKESLLKEIFGYAQIVAIFIVALIITYEKIKRWHYGRNGRDRRASDGSNSTNGSLKRIEKSLKFLTSSITGVHRRIDDSVIEIVKVSTVVNEQKEQCTKTVARFDETIADQNKALLGIAMEK